MTSIDPYGRFFSAQEQDGSSGECGLHSIRNLLQTFDVTKENLHQSAVSVATVTGDELYNHECDGAWWSADAIICELTRRGLITDYHNGDLDFEEPSILGFIVQIPEQFHFITVRRSMRNKDSVEVVDSLTGIETMRMRRLALNAKQNRWNVIAVRRKV
jgi:hypothetical protein